MEKSKDLLKSAFNIITEIKDDEVNKESLNEVNGTNIFGAKSSALIDKFIAHYKIRNDHNRVLRILFFSFSFFLILAVVAAFVAFIIIVANFGVINVEAAVSICGVCGTVLTTLIVLPKLVGKNLFPETEDKEILKFVKEMNETELEFAKLMTKLETKDNITQEKSDCKK